MVGGMKKIQIYSPISIHAPVKNATPFLDGKGHAHADFNPRAREGRDLFWLTFIALRDISIHAPMKGAT